MSPINLPFRVTMLHGLFARFPLFMHANFHRRQQENRTKPQTAKHLNIAIRQVFPTQTKRHADREKRFGGREKRNFVAPSAKARVGNLECIVPQCSTYRTESRFRLHQRLSSNWGHQSKGPDNSKGSVKTEKMPSPKWYVYDDFQLGCRRYVYSNVFVIN